MLKSYKQLFQYYKQLGEKSFQQIENEEQFFWSPSQESNSIAVIVQHLYGNMKSRWTEFLSTDGEKEWRNRDQEFELYISYKEEVFKLWEDGWSCLFEALDKIDETNRNQLVYIRNKGHSIDEAIQRQLAHYAYHVGQIVFLTRMIIGEEWKSLSIPKGESKNYNQKANKGGKREEHFTDQLLDKDSSDTA